jgi:ATP-binding cassette subfamily B protein
VHLSRLDNDLDQWPKGLDTLIGEKCVTLSGGQKQRTAIARAVAKEPAILVLDDALSSVDTCTEEAVLESLHSFIERRTSIVIAHRLSTIREVDRIIVLHKGQIAEEGTHDHLLEHHGIYARPSPGGAGWRNESDRQSPRANP